MKYNLHSIVRFIPRTHISTGIALSMILGCLILTNYLPNDPRFLFPVVAVGAAPAVFIAVKRNNIVASPKRGVFRLDLSNKYLSISFLLSFTLAILFSPIGINTNYILFYCFITASSLIIFLQILWTTTPDSFVLLEIIALSGIIRASPYYTFPTIPGSDTNNTHVPTILESIEQGFLYSPGSYYEAFPISHLRVITTMFITDIGLKDGIFLGLYLPTSLGLLFVFLFLRHLYNNKAGLLGMLFLAVLAFHIPYGFNRIPQATTVTLLPLFLYLIFRYRERYLILLLVTFAAILFSHNSTVWVILFFFTGFLLMKLLWNVISSKEIDQLSTVPIIFIFIMAIGKFQHIFISDFTHNIMRIVRIISYAVGYRTHAVQVGTEPTGPGAGEYIFFLFSAPYLLMAFILTLASLYIFDNLVVRQRSHFEFIWLIPLGIMWTVGGLLFITGAPHSTKVFAAMSILALPMVYKVFELLNNHKTVAIALFMVLLVVSITMSGTLFPRANADDHVRSDRSAINQPEEQTIEYADNFIDDEILTDSLIDRYSYKTENTQFHRASLIDHTDQPYTIVRELLKSQFATENDCKIYDSYGTSIYNTC